MTGPEPKAMLRPVKKGDSEPERNVPSSLGCGKIGDERSGTGSDGEVSRYKRSCCGEVGDLLFGGVRWGICASTSDGERLKAG